MRCNARIAPWSFHRNRRRRRNRPEIETAISRGLSLAAVTGIVRANRGALWCPASPGSTFQVPFPCTDTTEGPPRGGTCRHPARRTAALTRWYTTNRALPGSAQFLESSGFSIPTACDGANAIGVCETHAAEVAALVLDLTRPATNGESRGRVARLRAEAAIVFRSGFSEPQVAGRFHERPTGVPEEAVPTRRTARDDSAGAPAGHWMDGLPR